MAASDTALHETRAGKSCAGEVARLLLCFVAGSYQSMGVAQQLQSGLIAPAYVFFASAVDSSYITGEVLTLLGGETRAG